MDLNKHQCQWLNCHRKAVSPNGFLAMDVCSQHLIESHKLAKEVAEWRENNPEEHAKQIADAGNK